VVNNNEWSTLTSGNIGRQGEDKQLFSGAAILRGGKAVDLSQTHTQNASYNKYQTLYSIGSSYAFTMLYL